MSSFFIMPYCYIIYSQKLSKYYIGVCTDFERRFYEHNIGHSKFTATGIPWEKKFIREFETLQQAKAFESHIKKMKSRKFIEKLIGS